MKLAKKTTTAEMTIGSHNDVSETMGASKRVGLRRAVYTLSQNDKVSARDDDPRAPAVRGHPVDTGRTHPPRGPEFAAPSRVRRGHVRQIRAGVLLHRRALLRHPSPDRQTPDRRGGETGWTQLQLPVRNDRTVVRN